MENWLRHQGRAELSLCDCGLLAPGMKADVNVIDYDRLTFGPPRMVHDLPAGEQSGEGAIHVDATRLRVEVEEEEGLRPWRRVREQA